MTLSVGKSISIILVITIITFCTRAIPFIIFNSKKETPEFIIYIGKVLPPAIIGMLIIYCLKNVSISLFPFGMPELISIFVVVILHLWKRNNLISILGGTVLYMGLVQFVF